MKKTYWVMMVVLVVSIAMNVWQCSHQPEAHREVTTDTLWRDTMIYAPVASETVRTDRVLFVTVPVTAWDTMHDSVTVPLPIEQRRYTDTLYTAWVSGYAPRLDSIRVREREVVTTITETVVKPLPRLTLGIQSGAGIGIFSRQPDIYVGVGGQWRLWPK